MIPAESNTISHEMSEVAHLGGEAKVISTLRWGQAAGLHGMPVRVLRGPRRAFGFVDNMPAAFASGLTGVLMTIISKVHS